MDIMRENTRIYEYLCRLEESKQWCEDNGAIKTDSLDSFEEEIRKGVILAQLTKSFAPNFVKKIFYSDKLQYRHTDNINYFFNGLKSISFPRVFLFETFDLYAKKNIPRVIYCLHAAAHYLEKKGQMVKMRSLIGEVSFTKEELKRKGEEIKNLGLNLPSFHDIKERLENKIAIENSKKTLSNFYRYKVKKILKEKQNSESWSDDHEKLKNSDAEKYQMKCKFEQVLKKKLKAILWQKSFENIIYQKKVTVYTLKRFLPLFFKQSDEMEKEEEIEDLHSEIIKKRKAVFDLEKYLEEIKIKIMLLANNKISLSKISLVRPPEYSIPYLPIESKNHRIFQKIFYILQKKPSYLFNIIKNSDDKEEAIQKFLLPLFSFVRSKREEFLVSKLVDFFMEKDSEESEISTTLVLQIYSKTKEGMEFEKRVLGIIKYLDDNNTEEIVSDVFNYFKKNVRQFPLYLRKFFWNICQKKNGKRIIANNFLALYFINANFNGEFLSKQAILRITNQLELIMKEDEIFEKVSKEEFSTSLAKNHDKKLIQIKNYPEYRKSVIYFTAEDCNRFLNIIMNTLELEEGDKLKALISDAENFESSKYMIPFYLNDPELIEEEDNENSGLINFVNKVKQKILFLMSISDGRSIKNMLHNTEESEISLFEKQFKFFKGYNLDFCSASERESNFAEVETPSVDELSDAHSKSLTSISRFKKSLMEDLSSLINKKTIASFEDVLGMLAQDIITLKLMNNERMLELSLNKKTNINLGKKISYLKNKSKAYEEYLTSFVSKLLIKKKSSIFNLKSEEENEKDSLYGTYRYSANRLRSKGVLVSVKEEYEDVIKTISFYLMCDEPLVFKVEMIVGEKSFGMEFLRIDELLKMRCHNVELFNVCGYATFSVSCFVDLINSKYME